ncbi:MAG TPA: hypothetical protein VGJ26_08300 [Pirellulales bacterium]|jgi:hypothetical protein
MEWLQNLVRWIVGAFMAGFFCVFLFSMWITFTNRSRSTPPTSNPDPPPER